MNRLSLSLLLLVLPLCAAAQSDAPQSDAPISDTQAQAAQRIYTLSNTFERDPQFSAAFAPDFGPVQAQETGKSVLIVDRCQATALFAHRSGLYMAVTGEFETTGITMTFDLTLSDLILADDGLPYSYSDGSFFEPGKPQQDSAQSTLATGQIRFASRADVTVVMRETQPNVLSLENVGTGPILRQTVVNEARFSMTSAVSKARMQALADAILTYKRDFCTVSS